MPRYFWSALRVLPGDETPVASRCERTGLRFYLPRCAEPQASGDTLRRGRIMFPGYVFSRLPRVGWAVALTLRDVLDVVMTGEQPSELPIEALETLRGREDALGVIRLAPRFVEGDSVTVNWRAYENQPAEFVEKRARGAARVLMTILERPTVLEVPEHALSAA
jgi:transcription antitermination factor NusG